MTTSTEDLRNLADLNGLCGDLATELLAARAKLEAAEKLAEALKRAKEERHLVRMKDCDAVYDVMLGIDTDTALAAWEAAQ